MAHQPPERPAAPRVAVVVLPPEIRVTNAQQIARQLAGALSWAGTVVADMTATTFCDPAGVAMLANARRQAIRTGAGLRLVVPSPAVQHALSITELDRLLPVFTAFGEDTLGPLFAPRAPAA